MSIARDLAGWMQAARPDPLALAVMRLSFFDWLAVGIAGRNESVSRLVRAMALDEGGADRACLFGSARRLPERAAALVNGTTSHALDYDDTHFAHIGHPSVAVWPAVMALSRRSGAPASDLTRAALLGAEASIAVGLWLGRRHYEAGFHQTATAGAFGATVAAAALLGLTAEQTAQALGLAATRASGLKAQFGTMGKPFNAGIAASNGVECALLAAGGFVSTPEALDGSFGFGATHGAEGQWPGLDGEWRFISVSHKLHACCHGIHAALEALGLLGLAADQVASVRVQLHPRWLDVCAKPQPGTGLEAKFSTAQALALALLGHPTGALDTFSDALARDAAAVELRGRIAVTGDAALADTAARVEVVLRDGTRRTADHDLDAPHPLDTRQAKVRAKAAALLGQGPADHLWQAVEQGDLPAIEIAMAG